MTLIIKELNLSFLILSQEVLKNGDVKFFGFLESPLIKSYCYISQAQINEIQKEFKLEESKHEISPSKVNLWTKDRAIKENKYFNIGLLYLIKENLKSDFNIYKKYPVLELLLSDQPEIFYELKNKIYSYKDMPNFRFSNFLFNQPNSKEGICYQIKDMTSSHEISTFIFGDNYPPRAKKIIMPLMIKKLSKNDYEVNFTLVRIIHFLRLFLSIDSILYIIEHRLDQLLNHQLFKSNLYLHGLMNEKINYGLLKYLSHWESEKDKMREFMRFNIPNNRTLTQFSEIMKLAYDHFKPDVKKASDALYFFNNLSRDYGRLKVPNYKLRMVSNSKYKAQMEAWDSLKYEGYNYVVPKDYYTLLQWGSDLNNCAGNFHSDESYKDLLLVGIIKNNKIKYLVSFKRFGERLEISQFKGFKNSIPSPQELKLLSKPFESHIANFKDNLKDLLEEDETVIRA